MRNPCEIRHAGGEYPVANAIFKIRTDPFLFENRAAGAKQLGVAYYRRMADLFERALAAARRHFESENFVLQHDGVLKIKKDSNRELDSVAIELDTTFAFNCAFMARLEENVKARKTGSSTPEKWSVFGHLITGKRSLVGLGLNDKGQFYLHRDLELPYTFGALVESFGQRPLGEVRDLCDQLCRFSKS